MAKVMILGGGFGGLAAAHELRGRLAGEHEIVVVAADDRFFVGYAKLWDLVGTRPLEQGTGSLRRLDERGIRFLQAQITSVDPDRRSVETSAGRLEADYLIVAMGAAGDQALLGGAEHSAHNLYDPGRLPVMRRELERIEKGRILVAVLGVPYVCPPAPYETAFLVEDLLRKRGIRDNVEVTVATPMPSPLPVAGPEADEVVAHGLARQGIDLRTGVKVVEVDTQTNRVSFADGTSLDYAVLLAVPQAVPPAVLAESPLAGEDGWIWPDPETGRTSFENVYAVGDCTAVENLPRAGVFAEALGRVAGANIAAQITGGHDSRYDGSGYCFLEFNGRKAAALEGNFFTKPKPTVNLTEPNAENYVLKEKFEAERLQTWLGVTPSATTA